MFRSVGSGGLIAAHEALERKAEDVRSREESLQKAYLDVMAKQGQLRVMEELMEDQCQDLDSLHWLIDERLEEVVGKEKQLDQREEELRRQNEQAVQKLGELEAESAKLKERLQEVEFREKRYEGRLREFELANLQFELDREKLSETLTELEAKDERIELTLRELDSKNKELLQRSKAFELEVERFDLDRQKLKEQLSKVDQSAEERSRELDRKAQQLERQLVDLDSREKEFAEQVEKFKLMESKFEERSKEVGQKSKQCEEKCKEIQNLKVRGGIVMDGKNLQVLLNECRREHEKVRDGVSFLLRMSPDPARFVLDAMQGFFPPHLKKGDVEFKGSDVWASCILLLEQLMKISPNIDPDVQGEARKLSFNWMTKLKPDSKYSCRILGFLLLVAAYKLRETFDDGEIITYLKVIAQRKQLPELCEILGFKNEIPGVIRDLLERKEHLAVIRLASAFDLLREFPPGDILKEFMEISRSSFGTIFYDGNSSLDAQTRATGKRIGELKAAIRCIEDHKLNAEFSPVNIRADICELEKQLVEQKKAELQNVVAEKATPIVAPDTPLQQPRTMEHSQTSVSLQVLPSANASTVGLLPHQDLSEKGNAIRNPISTPTKNGKPELQLCKPVDADVEGLRVLLRGDMDDMLVQNKVINRLKSTSEGATLVLDAIWGRNLASLEKDGLSAELGIPVKGAIFLLKQLKRATYVVKSQLHGIVNKIYKLSLTTKGSSTMKVILFLQFLDAYKVPHDADKVIGLLEPSVWRNEFMNSCRQLGLQDFIPNFIKSLTQKNPRLNAVKYIHAMGLESNFNVIGILRDHLEYWKKKAGDLPKGSGERAFDMKLGAAEDVIKCIHTCKLESTCRPREFEEYIEDLKKQRSSAPRELESKAVASLAVPKRKAAECFDAERDMTRPASAAGKSNSEIEPWQQMPKKRRIPQVSGKLSG